jgi:uncharacterized protein affecting Mg2+/Co2+ transport
VAEQVEIETLLLANHVESVNGLLYISGGGWTDHRRAIQPGGQAPVSHFGVGLSVSIPWNETNQAHRLVVRVENDDATVVVANVETQLTVGRPPQIAQGSAQHAVIAISIDTIFPQAGGYRVVARIGEREDIKTWAFRVHDVATPPTLGQLL